ncbi:amino acid ABC transporter permease [Ilumatobacter sp.]|uniref:amino acid ABC transporter permease n=1 Tax=Ilumatobacter sp. TaxID=1967498 RepID=UPI003AF9A7ED
MIIFLLWVVAIGVAATIAYMIGRLLLDCYRVIAQRRYDKSVDQLAPLWRDTKVLAILAQVVFAVVVGMVFWYLWGNFRARTDAIGLTLTFDFLDQPAGITIADNALTPADTVGEAITAGFFNTLRVIVIGIPLAVILGTLVGIARLSSNWLMRKLATGYVEFFRNIPPLVVILFIWSGVYLTAFPRSSESWTPLNTFIFNNSRFAFPSIEGLDNFITYRWILLIALIVAGGVVYWRTKVFIETGHPHHRVLWGLATFLVISVIAFVALGGPAKVSRPTIDEAGRVYEGGIRMQMPYAALVTALVLYTATHIAEIVRGSIQAVHKGQVEASEALALSGFQRYRFVILPQAMRIAFPPLINQFLNFSKNSSLAIAIGFGEMTSIIFNLAGQSLPAPQLVLILMLLYLVISLVLSAIGNIINRRLQIVGR